MAGKEAPHPSLRSFAASVGERQIAWEGLDKLATSVAQLGKPTIHNPRSRATLGYYRPAASCRAVLADMDYISYFIERGLPVPSFREAGPREHLYFEPRTVRAAVITSGGIAPGLNRVLHSIAMRHCTTYQMDFTSGGELLGVFDGIAGLLSEKMDCCRLTPDMTEKHLDEGGSMLGSRRQYGVALAEMRKRVAAVLRAERINILYVIGGDGSLRAANELAQEVPDVAVVGVPKTMDNDILWVNPSFGFQSSVEKAVEVLGSLRTESNSTRRIGIVELFGAKSGFVAANAAHAFGLADLVLIPEMFEGYTEPSALKAALIRALDHVRRLVAESERASGLIVIAEGVGMIMKEHGVKLCDDPAVRDEFTYQVEGYLKRKLRNARGDEVGTFVNRPRHHIRAFPPNAADQTYCDRLGALAVETALAGFSRCIVSQWLSEFVLVPLDLVAAGKKHLTTTGMFWRQIMQATGQPDVSAKPVD
jgi:6-phosphofructokinase 1